MAENSKPMNSAIANGALSPLATVPITSARAMPIDTAVTATAVDSASAAVVMSSTQATFLSLGAKSLGANSLGVNSLAAQARRAFCSSLLRRRQWLEHVQSPRISLLTCREDRRGYRHRFVRTWAKALTNKGDFMFWVNEALTREHFAGRCDSAATRTFVPWHHSAATTTAG